MTRDEARKIIDQAQDAEKLLELLAVIKKELIAESVHRMINNVNTWEEFVTEKAYLRALNSLISKLTYKKSLYTMKKEEIQKALAEEE